MDSSRGSAWGRGSEDAGLPELSLPEYVQEKRIPVGSLLCF